MNTTGKIISSILLLLCACHAMSPQSPSEYQNEAIIEEILSRLLEEEERETDYYAYSDELYERMQSPIDLNRADREDLESLPFLSDIQVENLLYYLYRYGDMQTIYELRLVEGMDEETIRLLLPFVSVESGERKAEKMYAREVWKYGRHELYTRFGGTVEQAKGYQSVDGAEPAYAGSPLQHQLKYRFRYKDRVWVGLTAEKDAGEPFMQNKRVYDFVSAYAQIDKIWHFKTIVLGSFRASFGEGLVLNSGFNLGKSSQVLNTGRSSSGLRRSTSTDEYNYFHGAGGTVSLGDFDITAFYSNKKIDGDTTGSTFSSIVRTGLHRTATERQRRHSVRQQVTGGDVTFSRGRMEIGATAVHTRLSHTLLPSSNVYNAGYFQGDRQTTAGIHYRFRLGKLNVSGETALTNGPAAATVNGFSLMPFSRLGLVVQHRYLSWKYDTFFSGIFAQTSSRCINEHGVYIGIEAYPFKRWKVSAYADMFRHPWLRYGISSPSDGLDCLLNVEFRPENSWRMYWRVNAKLLETNNTQTQQTTYEVIPYDRWQFRYVVERTYGRFRFQTQLYANIARRDTQPWTYGAAALQDISFSFKKIPLKVDLRYQFFDVENYDNRIYSYERDVLHAFSMLMNYGLGSRYYLNLRYDVLENLTLWFKVAQTVYADGREYVGTGNDQTEGRRRTTLRALLRWKF